MTSGATAPAWRRRLVDPWRIRRNPTRQSRNSRKTRPTAATRRAVTAGQQVASGVLRQRATALRSRKTAIANAPRRARARAVPIDPRFVRAVGPKGVATLVAEGDSWFDALIDRFNKMVKSVADGFPHVAIRQHAAA